MKEYTKTNRALKKLKKIASSYSFGRILGLISYIENTSVSELFEQNYKVPSERLINSEIAFLAALWLENYKKNDGILWNKEYDIQKLKDVYRLMDLYHKSLKSHQFGKAICEIAVYEGDGGYDWEFIELAISKYECVKNELKKHFDVNLDAVPRFYEKLKNQMYINLNLPEAIACEQNLKDGTNAFKLFQISKEKFESIFDADEIIVAKMFISKLGCYNGDFINNIFDFNEFNAHPIIELPNGNLLIMNFYILAKAIYESPFYWICGLPKDISLKLLVRLGHEGSEIAAKGILEKLEFDAIHKEVKIDRSKTQNETDIDILLLHNKEAVVFQVKSQRLTIEARHGIEEKIYDNFDKAVIKAYNQGIISVKSLVNKDHHKELQYINGLEHIDKYHIICLTSEYYPTITPVCMLRQNDVAYNGFPLVGMTLLDLSAICNLLDADTFIQYLNFREKCAEMEVYGDNEMYYLGKFIESIIEKEKPLVTHQKLSNSYALLVDAIIMSLHNIGVKNNTLNYFIKSSMDILDDSKPINFNNRAVERVSNILNHLHKENVTTYNSLIKRH